MGTKDFYAALEGNQPDNFNIDEQNLIYRKSSINRNDSYSSDENENNFTAGDNWDEDDPDNE